MKWLSYSAPAKNTSQDLQPRIDVNRTRTNFMSEDSKLSEQLIYQGRVIRVNLERVRLPNNHVADLEIIHHPGGAAIVAVDEQQRVCMLKQYRHAAGGYIWELPAGKID